MANKNVWIVSFMHIEKTTPVDCHQGRIGFQLFPKKKDADSFFLGLKMANIDEVYLSKIVKKSIQNIKK